MKKHLKSEKNKIEKYFAYIEKYFIEEIKKYI